MPKYFTVLDANTSTITTTAPPPLLPRADPGRHPQQTAAKENKCSLKFALDKEAARPQELKVDARNATRRDDLLVRDILLFAFPPLSLPCRPPRQHTKRETLHHVNTSYLHYTPPLKCPSPGRRPDREQQPG